MPAYYNTKHLIYIFGICSFFFLEQRKRAACHFH